MSGDSGALDRVRRYCESWHGLSGDIRIDEDPRVPALTLGDLRQLLHMASEGVR